jgi:NCS2 family nucleobase:cation symporter-2
MGLQHSFAMVGGLITPPYVIFRFSVDFNDVQTQQYAISAALIASGICSIIQVTQLPIPFSERLFRRKLFIGSGVLSVMGVSFTFLPIFEIAINQMKANGIDGNTAYGNMLGTSMVCCLLEVFLSLCPIAFLHRVFPPLVSSITVILIGVALTGTGMKYWGGGVVCAEMVWKEHDQAVAATGIDPIPGPVCTNGEVNLGYGSAEFIGLGFSVMIFLVFIELFGSVFMKNCNGMYSILTHVRGS